MIRVVVDASVAAKWCFPAQQETLVRESEDLLASYRDGQIDCMVPDLFWPELANVLWKGVWKRKIDSAWAEQAYSKVRELDLTTLPSSDFVPSALRLAINHHRSVYDSVYVTMAMTSRAELITADERLANALAAIFPVKWLGALR